MTKTIFTHKSKGTKLTFVKDLDSKISIVKNENGDEMTIANITLSRWYDSEEVKTEEVKVEEAKTDEVKTATENTNEKTKKSARKIITLDEVINSAYISTSITGATENGPLTASIYVYSYGKFTRSEAIIYLGDDTYRFGTVMTYEGDVVSSYYLLNDSKVGLETIQRKGINSAVSILADQLNLSGDLLKAILMTSRDVARGV